MFSEKAGILHKCIGRELNPLSCSQGSIKWWGLWRWNSILGHCQPRNAQSPVSVTTWTAQESWLSSSGADGTPTEYLVYQSQYQIQALKLWGLLNRQPGKRCCAKNSSRQSGVSLIPHFPIESGLRDTRDPESSPFQLTSHLHSRHSIADCFDLRVGWQDTEVF